MSNNQEVKGAVTCLSVYQFKAIPAAQLPVLRKNWRERCLSLHLKGTILLSPEGINAFLAGTASAVAAMRTEFETAGFEDMPYKYSYCDEPPFTRMLVRLKREIITFKQSTVEPEKHTAPHLPAETLRQWYADGKDMLVLDTRNDYEVRVGKFKQAIDFNIQNFTDFTRQISQLPPEAKEKPVVTYCTGGIRCEKAAEWMLQAGFKNVYQLDGGILRYFETCGGDHYEGDCFVFDKRVALSPDLKPTEAKLCFSCWQPLQKDEQPVDDICPYCHKHMGGKRALAHQPKSHVSDVVRS